MPGLVNSTTTLLELAALISQALEVAGVGATLSGGAAVSVYSENEYESVDLDFITSARNDLIARALRPLGFEHRPGKREFTHPDTSLYAEFPAGPLAFGRTVAGDQDATVVDTEFGPVRIVTPTQSVMDRLAHYVAWNDNQAFDQAVMVARRCPMDWNALEKWAEREGAPTRVLDQLRAKSALLG